MVKIPEITFSRTDSQGNCQNVTVSSFYMDKYDVTINEWAEYLTKSRELDSNGLVPKKVFWNLNANGYRLPTVAEWQAVSELYSREPDYEYFLNPMFWMTK